MKNFFIWIAAAAGSLFGVHSQTPSLPANVPVAQTQINQSITSVATSSSTSNNARADITADWQTYKGSNFSIKYPPGWSIMESSETSNTAGAIFLGHKSADSFTPELRLSIYKNGGQYNDVILAIATEMEKNSEAEVSSSTISIDGVTGTKVDEISVAGGGAPWYNDDTSVLFQKGTVEYQLKGSFEKSDASGAATFNGFYESLQLSQ